MVGMIPRRRVPLSGWLSRREEAAMFAPWDDTFRRIRRQLTDAGVHTPAAEDTTSLHTANVMTRLRPVHESARALVGLR